MLIWWVKPANLFGATMITWNFGSWKTFWTFYEIYKQALHNPDYLVIANLPYKITWIYFNSFNDLCKLIDYMYRYFTLSNDEINNLQKYKNVIFVIDEVHLYFPARQSMDKSRALIRNKLNTVITQCRKRNIKFWFITQRAQKTDIEFRRLADFIRFYKFNRFFWMPINRLSIIKSWWWLSDLIWEDWTTWENEEELKKDIVYSGVASHNTFFFRRETKMLHKDWALWSEKNLTNHICWIKHLDEEWNFTADSWEDFFTMSFDEFLEKLKKVPSKEKKYIFELRTNKILWQSIPKLRLDYIKYLDFSKNTLKVQMC